MNEWRKGTKRETRRIEEIEEKKEWANQEVNVWMNEGMEKKWNKWMGKWTIREKEGKPMKEMNEL